MNADTALERIRMQPGLFLAAQAACSHRLTDGFCTPRNVADCRCWRNAEVVMTATGLSAQAVAWIFQHLAHIERAAAEEAKRNGK